MTRKNGPNGSFLSGIGTMVTQLEICPACGHAHEEGLVEYFAGSRTADEAPVTAPRASQHVSRYAQPEVPVVRPIARRTKAPAVPWPMPPISEGYP